MYIATLDGYSFQELKSEVAVIYDLLISHRGVLKFSSPAPGFNAGGGFRFFAHSTDPPSAVGFYFAREGVVNAAQFGEARFRQKFQHLIFIF